MAVVEVTISGVMYDKLNRTMQNVVLIGEASLTGLGVGGGPIIPPGGPPSSPPDYIWGGGPKPTPPIGYPPGQGPIIDPGPPGTKPPDPVAPPVEWKAIWHPTEGWVAVGVVNPDLPHPTPSS